MRGAEGGCTMEKREKTILFLAGEYLTFQEADGLWRGLKEKDYLPD
jgi:hypothetical protein